jgi:hypothetical protein
LASGDQKLIGLAQDPLSARRPLIQRRFSGFIWVSQGDVVLQKMTSTPK